MKSRLVSCPVCSRSSNAQISADLYKCRKCSLVFNVNYKSLSYGRDYFISDYLEQYGKTYIDDFDNIYNLSKDRFKKITGMIKDRKNDLSVLDIGSAAGFFLKAAEDSGAKKVRGIEISKFAADYCKKNFSIDVIESSFENAEIDEKFDVISSWFFIEHLADTKKAIDKIYRMLNDGGVFALAVPSCFGPMFYFTRDEWIKTHPGDHRIDLSPRGAVKIFKDAGFKKVKVFKSGYHPERAVSRENILFKPFELFYRIFSSMTAFSDTIEIYAVK